MQPGLTLKRSSRLLFDRPACPLRVGGRPGRPTLKAKGSAMSDIPVQPGKYYRLGKFRFEHQLNGLWGVSDRMRGVGNCRTPVGALIRYWRAPHVSTRMQDSLIRLRLYPLTMKALHRLGQCFMVTKPGPDSLRRECTWCGTKGRLANGSYPRGGSLPSALTTVRNSGDAAEQVMPDPAYTRERYGKSGE